ncbi:MAG TPA: hypothetical protein DIW44_03935 [Anaerolineaceae bacterium]|nr:hypothetical protein [Anaerolineaceae bacterium]
MESKNSLDLLLAAHLVKPFLLPGQSGQPLSLRCLPDGGMVVIAVDGRKLWFTALEVCRAKRTLGQSATKSTVLPADANVKPLHEVDLRKSKLNNRPIGKSRDGMSEMIVLPPSLKHLEEEVNANNRKYQKPRKADPR